MATSSLEQNQTQDKANVGQERPPIQSNPYIERLSNLGKVIKEKMPGTQLGFGDNGRGMEGPLIDLENFLNKNFDGVDENLKTKLLELKKIDVFAPQTEYDPVNKILHIAPKTTFGDIEKVLAEKATVDGELMEALGDMPEEEAPEEHEMQISDNDLTPAPDQIEPEIKKEKTYEEILAEIDLLQKNNDDYVEKKGWRKVASAISGLATNTMANTMESEKVRAVLASKVVQGYMNLSREQRLAINFTLGTAAGFAIGSAASVGAVGYGIARVARVGASFGGSQLGTAIGENKKNWSEDFIKSEEEKEIENVKQFKFDPEKEEGDIAKIKERYERERKNIKLKKMALTVGMGAGAGILEGLTENALGHAGTVANTLDGKPKPMNIHQDISKTTPIEQHVDKIINKAPELPKINIPPESLKVIPVKGDGLWNVLKHPLENNPDIARLKLNDAQKQYILSYYTNKGMAHPDMLGSVSDPKFGVKIELGKEVDLSKLMGNPEELQRVISKASSLSADVQKEIVERSQNIASYAKSHPTEPMTLEKVSEASTVKPVAETISPKPLVAPVKPALNPEAYEFHKPDNILQNSGVKASTAAGSMTGATLAGSAINGALSSDIPMSVGMANAKPRSMEGDITSSQYALKVKDIMENGLNEPYGEKASFIMFRREKKGVDSKEWQIMKGLDAIQVLKYFKKDYLNSTLSPKIVEELKSPKHLKFMSNLQGVMAETRVRDPLPGENVEAFLKRMINMIIKK